MNERLKILRKTLGLTMEEFGKTIGVTRSSISQLESGKNNLTDQTIISISNSFNANPDWLRTGEGEIFLDTKEGFLDMLSKQYALDEMDLHIITTFLELDQDKRVAIKEYIGNLVGKLENGNENKDILKNDFANYAENKNYASSQNHYVTQRNVYVQEQEKKYTTSEELD